MPFEVEIKALIGPDPAGGTDSDTPRGLTESDRIEAEIARICEFRKEFRKKDIYYHIPGDPDPTSFRIRDDTGTPVVTYKNKTMAGNAEVNEEHEFTVSDEGEFRGLISLMGAGEVIRKEKRGKAYRYGDLTVEVCTVAGLGRFVEVEALLDSADKAGDSIGKIREFLARVGIREEQICKRYYIDMLMEASRSFP